MPDIKPHRIFTNGPKNVKMVGFCSSLPRHSDSTTELLKTFLCKAVMGFLLELHAKSP
jgi:hypothetical protein